MSKLMFEATYSEIADYCETREECVECPYMFEYGICAKDIAKDSEHELRKLLIFLTREIKL